MTSQKDRESGERVGHRASDRLLSARVWLMAFSVIIHFFPES